MHKKAFLHQKEDGEYLCYCCSFTHGELLIDDDVEVLVHNLKSDIAVRIKGKTLKLQKSSTNDAPVMQRIQESTAI